MTTLLDEPAAPTATNHAERLQAAMAAVRVAFTWLGTRKTLTPEQKSEAAEPFGAAREFLSAGKKLLDTSHPAFKAVTAVRGRIIHYWKSVSLPYPEPGIRLIRQSDIGAFDVQLTSLKDELVTAVATLNCEYSALKAAARRRLGRLYNSADYPLSLESLFDVAWDYPSVEPPPYLQQLSPELYRQECERVRSRFEEAVHLAEQAFIEEFARLVAHLTERLAGGEEGQPKIFRDSIVENLHEFFGRFRTLNIGSHQQLEELVDEAQGIVRGVMPQTLRDSSSLRQHVATQLSTVQASLDGLLVDRPRRRILRGGSNGRAGDPS